MTPRKTMITAHSGAEGEAENTIRFVARALTLGCDAFEVDVTPVMGRLCLTHDAPASDKGLDTLEDCFRVMAEAESGMLCNCDVKRCGLAEGVLSLAEQCGVTKWLVFTGSVSDGDARAIEEAGASWWMNASLPEKDFAGALIAEMDRRRAAWANLHYAFVTEETLRAVHARGGFVSAWTADTEEEMLRLLSLGADNVTSRRPLRLTALRDARR